MQYGAYSVTTPAAKFRAYFNNMAHRQYLCLNYCRGIKKRNVPLQRNVPFQRNIPLQRNVPFQREITLLRCMESFPLQHSPNPQHFLHALCATIN